MRQFVAVAIGYSKRGVLKLKEFDRDKEKRQADG